MSATTNESNDTQTSLEQQKNVNNRSVKRKLQPETLLQTLEHLSNTSSVLKENKHWQKFVFSQEVESVYTIKSGDVLINLDNKRLRALKERNNVIYVSLQTKKSMKTENVNSFDIGDDVSRAASIFFVYILASPAEMIPKLGNTLLKWNCNLSVLALLHKYDPSVFDYCWDSLSNTINKYFKYDKILEANRLVPLFPDFCREAELYGKLIDPDALRNYLYYLPHMAMDLPEAQRTFVDPYAEEWMTTNILLWESEDKDKMQKVGEARHARESGILSSHAFSFRG